MPVLTASSLNLGDPILLTDGTFLLQAFDSNGFSTGTWYRLAPDQNGSYVDSSVISQSTMPAGYAPTWHASAVLPDGRVLVEGGEYNGDSEVETPMGAIYDPIANTWTSVSPPGWPPPPPPYTWPSIGDAQSVIFPSGTLMLGNCCYTEDALFNASTLSWTTLSNTGKLDYNSEEGWVLLPNGKVLTVDMTSGGGTQSELFDPSSLTWSAGPQLPVSIGFACSGPGFADETGPMALRPNGTVVAIGGNGQLAIYNPTLNSWAAGPVVGGGFGEADGPAVVLPDGNVFFQVSPYTNGCYQKGSEFLEYGDGGLGQDPSGPHAGSDASYRAEMLLLPNGQVLYTDLTGEVEIYIPGGTYQSAWQPTISSVPATLVVGSAGNVLSGTQLNGLGQGSMYGDDAQMATNFPLVRITNNATGHVFYCRTHTFSTMAVATGSATVSAQFDVPAGMEVGESQLVVVANGIPSNPVSVFVDASQGTQNVTVSPTSLGFHSSGGSQVTESATLTNNGPGTLTFSGEWVTDDDGYFSLSSTNCGSQLGQGQSCGAQVTFDPGPYCLASPDNGTLYFSDTGTGGQQSVSLTGTTTRCLQKRTGGSQAKHGAPIVAPAAAPHDGASSGGGHDQNR